MFKCLNGDYFSGFNIGNYFDQQAPKTSNTKTSIIIKK